MPAKPGDGPDIHDTDYTATAELTAIWIREDFHDPMNQAPPGSVASIPSPPPNRLRTASELLIELTSTVEKPQ
ncbi:hypothetical protein ACGF1Z_34880 [Streptomyces sp. NPDC048018]|uniref:hypothetical protein n=1 Tax=Streptomyces sp. NPDC048018 TaxID=3365499 RepID=UPI0037183154